MSVFTTVTPDELRVWLQHYALGDLVELKGIASGITNTNYFVTTGAGRYVLTLFEKNSAEELPYFLDLMAHLARHGILCPQPLADNGGAYMGTLNGKPAALVSCLRGASLEHPAALHCSEVGAFLARMHLAGQSYPATMENPRGPHWWGVTAHAVAPLLDAGERKLLDDELAYQAKFRGLDLPRGVIHADLFRDNVLFDGDRLGGAIDFYYACNDVLAYDLAITVNDWCVDQEGALDTARLKAMLAAYHAQRPLSEQERAAWPALLRAGALRFWLSRLYDFHFPQPGEMTHAKDPGHFRRVLESRIRDEIAIRAVWG
ncbi:MAG TPA: homoserine kinase [Novimethylophilus sp.]|jgi:homoserine kinase type II|uniref:homoserine kinase n=1 Tax=Novimethylophilus sp. TaxID=2137426 RepID=UPI002F422717